MERDGPEALAGDEQGGSANGGRSPNREVAEEDALPASAVPPSAESPAGQGEPPDGQGMTGKVVRAAGWNAGGQILIVLASVVATPFTLRLLGPELYGLFALVTVMLGYLAFTDVGMSVASSKFGADAYARGDDDTEVAVVWTSLVISALPSIVVAVVVAVFAREIVVNLLHLSSDVAGVASAALRVATVGYVARLVAGVVNTPEAVRMRWDINASITSGGTILQILVVPLVLWVGGGLVSALGAVAGIAAVMALSHLLVSKRLQPRLWPPRLRRSLARPLLRFGSASMVSYATLIVLHNIDRLLLARLASVTEVAYYAVAAAGASLLNLIPSALGQPLIPAFAVLLARGRHAEARALYTRLMRLTFFVVMPVVVLLVAFARPGLAFWAGELYARHSAVPFFYLVVGLGFNAFAAVPGNLLWAANKAGLITRYHLLQLAPYLFAAVLLIRTFGARGAGLAWAARSLVNAAFYFWGARNLVGVSVRPNWRSFAKYATPAALLAGPVLLAVSLSMSAPVTLAVAVLAVGRYGFVLWRSLLSQAERRWVVTQGRALMRMTRPSLSQRP